MRSFKRNLSLLVVFVLLINLLLPVTGAFADYANNSAVSSNLNQNEEQTILSSEIFDDESLTSISDTNSEINVNENQFLDKDVEDLKSHIDKVEPQAVPVLVYATVILSRIGDKFVTAIQRVAASPAGQLAYKNFNSSNFRHNLIVKTDGDPTTKYQAHHIFPQKFANQWSRLNFNNCDPKYGTWVETPYYQSISTKYNNAWTDFFRPYDLNGTTPTLQAILSHGRELTKAYNLERYF
ncbi:hypothetical protein [Desulforamulus ruminis]|uniref:Uncharacterized protein n=1 Tax=Desulforamulus ruminis (strain ATCC 23193 / DSM 2154 / NCIMB 8452 / DL) TaxID=696281 RepID=F6DK79_DESRL|nr:hypothetical protein [Desulforamulus ruminis]AEG61496.1 hypothetical protein Desru_3290 [Desulforamulus ruminis DSM 2154]